MMAKLIGMMASMLPIEDIVDMVGKSCEEYKEAKLAENEEDAKNALTKLKANCTMLIMKDASDILGGGDKLMDHIDKAERQHEFFKKMDSPDKN